MQGSKLICGHYLPQGNTTTNHGYSIIDLDTATVKRSHILDAQSLGHGLQLASKVGQLVSMVLEGNILFVGDTQGHVNAIDLESKTRNVLYTHPKKLDIYQKREMF